MTLPTVNEGTDQKRILHERVRVRTVEQTVEVSAPKIQEEIVGHCTLFNVPVSGEARRFPGTCMSTLWRTTGLLMF